MKIVFPTYYKKFHCIANNCKNNCCSAGWEIDIDKKTLDYYKNTSGELGKKLKNNIDYHENPHFKLEKNGKCPFLNNENLCEIYIKLGEDKLCDICKEHPRFYEYFSGIKEGGIGLCCEESARIIISETQPFSTYEITINYKSCEHYNQNIYDYLHKARQKIIKYLENTKSPILFRIRDVLWYTHTLQQNIDFNLLDDEKIFTVKTYSNSDIRPILEFFLNLEPNDINWFKYIKKCINLIDIYNLKKLEFENLNPEISLYLKNISIYFIWRYFMKGTFDKDILSKVKLMVISISILKYLFFCKWIENKNINFSDYIEIVTKYSEEIEYSEENLNALEKASYDLDIFDTEYLLGLIQ